MKPNVFRLALLGLAFTGLACTAQLPITTPTLAPPPVPTIDIEATVTAVVAAALPSPIPTPNIDATVEARVKATVEAIPTPTPSPIPTQNPVSPTPTKRPPPVATIEPTPTLVRTTQVKKIVKLNPYRVIQNSVVKIFHETRGGTSHGSGVVIGRGDYVITNAHVVDRATSKIEVSFHTESGQPTVTTGQVVFSNANIDLALVKLGIPLGEPMEVSRGVPDLGDTLILGGFPGIGGETLTATTGKVAGFDFNGAVIKFDGQIGPGSSGGPAVNEEGKLVGIATALSREPSGGKLGLILSISAVGHSVVRALLEDSQTETEEHSSRYLLKLIGIPADAKVPDGWNFVANFGYFDMRAPGTATDHLGKDYRVVGIFTQHLIPGESPKVILERIVAESDGGFKLVPDSKIKPPDGFSECALLHNKDRFEMNTLEARGSVIGNGWISVAGLYTRFCVGETGSNVVIGYVESPGPESSKTDAELFSSTLTILPN